MASTADSSELLLGSLFSRGQAGEAALFGDMPFSWHRKKKKKKKRTGGNLLGFWKLLLMWIIHNVFSDTTDQIYHKSISIINGTVGTPPRRDTEYPVALSRTNHHRQNVSSYVLYDIERYSYNIASILGTFIIEKMGCIWRIQYYTLICWTSFYEI